MRKQIGEKRCFSPDEIALDWAVSRDKVIGWIRAGELRAFNAALKAGRRPIYRITEDDLRAFVASRELSVKGDATTNASTEPSEAT